MFNRLPDRPVSAYDDDWESLPAAGPFPKWFGGVIVPVIIASYGVACLVRRHVTLESRGSALQLDGTRAIALGVAAVGVALFLHCHYFWGNIYHLAAGATVGKILGLVGMIGGLGYLIVQIGIFG